MYKLRALCFIVFFQSSLAVSLFESFSNFDISFVKCMDLSVKFDARYIETRSDWKLVFKLYRKFIKSSLNTEILKIPKIIHQIWVGSPLPEKYKIWQKTWQKKHPDWKYILWTDKEIAELKLQNQAAYDATKNYGQKSDIARYEILYRFGGLYVDTDFECLNSFDILHYSCDFYTGLSYSSSVILYNGLIAARPGHPILKTCVDKLKLNNENTTGGILKSTGPYHLTRAYMDNIKTCGGTAIAFPVTYFYPWPEQKRLDKVVDRYSWVRPESFAIHHWEVSWRPEGKKSSVNMCDDEDNVNSLL